MEKILTDGWERRLETQFLKNDRCRKRAYICSPLSAETDEEVLANMRAARAYMLYAMEEMGYRICVLETFQSFCKSAPVTMDTRVMGYHFQLVDAYMRFILTERRFGQKADAEGQKKRETALQSFERVVQDGRKRFTSFKAGTQEQYRTSISQYVNTVLPVWMQYRNTYINL